MIKKLLTVAIFTFICNGVVKAETVQIGTGALALAVGITNVYAQVPVGDAAAITIEYASVEDLEVLGDTITATGFGATYKTYSGAYADSSFWKFGAASIDVTDGVTDAAGTMPVVLYGMETSLEENALYGFEVGLGTTAGFGLFNFYAGVQF